MEFDLDRAVEEGCIYVIPRQDLTRELPARIICRDMKIDSEYGDCKIIALADFGHIENMHFFDKSGEALYGNCYLKNKLKEIDVWVTAYEHFRDGSTVLSVKQSECDCNATMVEIKRLGHKIISVKEITMKEGEF